MADREVTVMPSGGDYDSLSHALADEFAAYPNLVTGLDGILSIKIDGSWSSEDATRVTIPAFTQNATHYLRIYTTATARHHGLWSTAHYMLSSSTDYEAALACAVEWTRIEGLQVKGTGRYSGASVVNVSVPNVTVAYCIGTSGGGVDTKDVFMASGTADSTTVFYNCLAFDSIGSGFMAGYSTGAGVKFLNCTAIDNNYGFGSYYTNATYINCLGHSNTTADWAITGGTPTLTLTTCASSDGTADDFAGSGNHVNHTFTFVNEGADDFHLGATDVGAIDLGTADPGSGLFSDDIDGTTRSGTWDIGADEYTSSGVTLVVADASHAHAVDNIALTQAHLLAVADALQGHIVDALTLTQAHLLALDDALHGHGAENVALTQAHLLAIADALHAHEAEAVALTQAHVLALQDALHGQNVENIALFQAHVLAIADALHDQTAENIVLSLSTLLAVADCLHSQSAENVALIQQHLLAIADALHAQGADNIALTQAHLLAVQDALMSMLVDNITLSTGLQTVFSVAVTPRDRIRDAAPRHRIRTVEPRDRIRDAAQKR